ncbi:hypothetical protein DL98DRAFT_512381 [Cadophora sp. DSE1049]|nr:hypothetical protein DL98DRAFT_512381 [Cadophora sp. DSE1049]
MPLTQKKKKDPFKITRLWHWQTSKRSSSTIPNTLEGSEGDASTAHIRPTDKTTSLAPGARSHGRQSVLDGEWTPPIMSEQGVEHLTWRSDSLLKTPETPNKPPIQSQTIPPPFRSTTFSGNSDTNPSAIQSNRYPHTPTSPSPLAKIPPSSDYSTKTLLDRLIKFDFDTQSCDYLQQLTVIWNTLRSRNLTRLEFKDLWLISQHSDASRRLNFQPDSIYFSAIFNPPPSTPDTVIRYCYVKNDESNENERNEGGVAGQDVGNLGKTEDMRLLFSFLPLGHILLGKHYTDWIVVLNQDKDIYFLRHNSFGKNFTYEDEDMNEALENDFECNSENEMGGLCSFNKETMS